MEPEDIKNIEEAIEKDTQWMQKELVFKIEEARSIDVVPFLSEGCQSSETLSFPNPPLLTQKELIAVFKRQAARQGVHLTQSASSSNLHSRGSRFFWLVCDRYLLYHRAKGNKRVDCCISNLNHFEPTVPCLYDAGVKMGRIRVSRLDRHKDGKK